MPDSMLSAATRSSRLLAVAVAVAVALVVACGGPGPAVTDGSPVAPAQANASPSARPSPSAAGPDPDAGAAVDAFRAFVQTEQSFHIAGDMLMTVRDVTIQAAITSDVGHGDEQGILDIRGRGVSIRLAIILVDSTVYVRLANRDWQKFPGRAGLSNPFGGLNLAGLAPVDIVNVAGVKTHHLRADTPEVIDAEVLSGNTLTDLKIASSTLDVYITDDGVPLTSILEFTGTGTFGGESGPVTARIRYDFSKFGEDVKIVAPIAASP